MKNYKLNYFQCYSLYGFQPVFFLPKSRIVLQFFFSSFFCIFLTIRKTIVTDFLAIVGVFIARRKCRTLTLISWENKLLVKTENSIMTKAAFSVHISLMKVYRFRYSISRLLHAFDLIGRILRLF